MADFKDKNERMKVAGFAALCLAILVVALVIALSGDENAETTVEAGPTAIDGTMAAEKEDTLDPALAPSFDIVRISRGGTGVVAGRAEPGAVVELTSNGEKIAEVTADINGEWVAILDQPLASGSAELNLVASLPGSVTREASDVVVVSVPEREEDRFVEREQSGVVAVLSPRDGKGASKILQKPGIAAFSEVGDSLVLDSIDYGAGHEAIVSGRALPRVEVRLYIDDVFAGLKKADDRGRWQLVLNQKMLTAGDHIMRVDQTVNEGNVRLRIEQPFSLGQPIDPSLAENGIIVQPGNTLWAIARQLYGSGVRYTVIFRENSEQIADPDLIYPGQVFKVPVKPSGTQTGSEPD